MNCGTMWVILCILFLTSSVFSEKCPKILSIDITNGSRQTNGDIFINNLTFSTKNYYESGNIVWGCVCNIRKCIRKCCPENTALVRGPSCNSSSYSGSLEFYDKDMLLDNVSESEFSFVYEKNCPENMERIQEEEFYLQKDGSVLIPEIDGYPEVTYSPEHFCIDLNNASSVLVCMMKEYKFPMVIIGMIISMPFLLVTFLVYLVLPDSNIHRKALMFYVMSLLIAYICLVSVQLYKEKIEPPSCEALGLCVVYFFLVSFFWMNVMCIDIFLAFRGLRGFTGKKSAETKRFLLYCLYALGLPTLHVLLLLTLNRVLDEKSVYSPQIGVTKCFLEDGIPNLLYFYGPMGVLLTINIILFILTAIKIQQVKKETSMLKHSDSKRHSYENDKQKFNLYVKLLLAMGVNWIMEIISWAFIWKMGQEVPNSVWYLTDFVNAMYGVLIFFIFVFKRKIWKSLQKRYYVFIGKPHLAHSTTMTQTTRSSNYSTTDTGLNEHRLSELRNGRAEERALTAS